MLWISTLKRRYIIASTPMRECLSPLPQAKITPDPLVRSAYVYIRQSTLDQVHRNHESRRRQYGLAERARQLGWADVVVIDDDLAISGDGVKRPGFERLLVAICEGRVGAVLTIEASRLARNGRDWHTLSGSPLGGCWSSVWIPGRRHPAGAPRA